MTMRKDINWAWPLVFVEEVEVDKIERLLEDDK